MAWRDGELAPGEATFVAEHVGRCSACAALDRALQDATPEPFLEIPADALARMHAAVDEAIRAEAERPAPPRRAPGLGERVSRWMRRERDLPQGTLVGYAVLLAACFGWGLSNWMALPDAPTPAIAAHASDAAPSAGAGAIPSEQYRPASYSPEDEGEGWR